MFATTEAEKVLPTIVSRCQRFDLRRIPMPLIVEHLRKISREEKIEVDDDALLAIARGAEGGLRDAESALDQLIAFTGGKIGEEDVLSVFGLVSRGMLESLGAGVLGHDVPGVLKLVAELDERGKDLQKVVQELMEHFRNLLICLNVDNPSEVLDLTDAQLKILRAQAGTTDTDRVLRVAAILAETEGRMKQALSKRVLLETALIRCARAAAVVSIDEILRKLEQFEGTPGGAAPVQAAEPVPPVPASRAVVRETPAQDESPAPRRAAGEMPLQDVKMDDMEKLRAHWHDVTDKVGKLAMDIRSSLSDLQPCRVEGDRVVVAIDEQFEQEKKALEGPRARKAFEHALALCLGRQVSVEFVVSDAVGASASGVSGGTKREPTPAHTKGSRRLIDDPLVEKATRVFKGRVTDVREGG
jgi:DNA polymerase-3 subunit gamma/tau